MDNGRSRNERSSRIWEFINNLDSLHLLKKDPDVEYVEDLIKRYNLPKDSFSKEALIVARKKMRQIRKEVPEPTLSYLKAFLRDIMLSKERPTAVYLAFLYGMLFEELIKNQKK